MGVMFIFTVKLLLLAALCGYTSYWDIKEKKVPNIATVTVMAAGILIAGVQWRLALMDAGLGMLLFLPLILVGLARMGDAKLCAAAAALVGFTSAGLGAWLGTVICALWLTFTEARRRRLGAWLAGHVAALGQLRAGCKPVGRYIPFAPFFAAGMVLALVWRWWA
ncbi:hypothetical protein A6M21_07590 [Desulfotomaculum copahuensis]|uniref:Prepilin type IV endopeptidase peptidase domain-containing protein n=2 Tax=Desulfotomaculum copahuensis TaxID=1838280 RepID=A0A1B7LG17_9FIRM|nr:hypothetical protein A6M21_07590 [Desulfotomaculum copahuensis]